MHTSSKRLMYLKCSMLYLIQNQFFLFIINLIDYLSIFSFFILSIDKIKAGLVTFDETSDVFFYFSPYNYYKQYLNYELVNDLVFDFGIGFAILFPIGYLLYLNMEIKANSFFTVIRKIQINFYEHFFFRLLFIFFIDSLMYKLIDIIFSSYDSTKEGDVFLVVFIHIAIFCIFIFGVMVHFTTNVVWSNMRVFNNSMSSYPFDMHYNIIYDIITTVIKCVITIEKNVFAFSNNVITSRVILFDGIPLLLLYSYFVYMLYSIFISDNNMLYFPLTTLSILRVFMINFTGFCLIYKLIISENLNFLFYFFTALTLVSFLLFYFEQLPRYITAKFSRAKDLIGVLFFLLSNDVNHTQCISNWIMNHKVKCRSNNCFICDYLHKNFSDVSIEDINLKHFFHFIYECVKYEIKRAKTKMRREIEINLDIIELMDLFLTENNQRIKFYVLFYKKLLKYKSSNTAILFNLYIMFEKVNELNADFVQSYQSFNESEGILKIFTKFFDDFDNFMRFEIKNPINIIKLSDKLFSFTNNTQVTKFLSQNVSNYSYEFLLLRYIFEAITHKPLQNNYEFFDVSQFTEFLNYHWQNDNFILINYGLLAQDCVIVKSSCDIRKHIGAAFESLFPRYIKNYGKAQFVNELNVNNFKDENNLFEYVINNLKNDEGYVEAFKMKFVMYPSIDTGEMLITGDFTYKHFSVIIVDVVNEKETIISYSENLSDVFVLSPIIIEELSLNQKTFEFGRLFKRRPLTTTTKGKETTSSSMYVYQFNFDNYLIQVKNYLDENCDVKNKELLIDRLASNKAAMINKVFSVKKIEEIENKCEKYKIYYMKTKKIAVTMNTGNAEDDDQHVHLDEAMNTQTFTKYMTQTGAESVSYSSSSESNRNRLRPKINEKDKANLKDQSYFKKVTSFIKIMMGYHFIVITISIIFTVLQVVQIVRFEGLFLLFQKFKFFKRAIDTELLRLSANACFQLNENETINNETGQLPDCTCFFKEYSQALQTSNEALSNDPLISDIVYEEFKLNINLIKSLYIEFTEKVYALSHSQINQIESMNVSMLFIRQDESEIKLVQNTETFFNAINLYINYFSQIINRDTLTITPVQLFTLSSDFVIENVNLGTPTEDQRLLYQLIINFPFLQKCLLSVQSMIQSWFNKYLCRINNIYTIFSLLIAFFCVVLALSKMLFIYQFTKMLNRKFTKIHKRIFCADFLKYFHSKYLHLRTLLTLYDKKPSDEINAIAREKEEYKKLLAEKKKEKITLPPEVKKKMKKKDTIDYRPFIKKYKLSIVMIYIVYSIIYIIIYFLLQDSLTHLEDLVKYSNINTDIDNYLNSNLNGIQFMSFTNNSENELGKFIYDNESIRFVTYGISNHLYSMKLIEVLKSKHPDLFGSSITKDNVSCDEIAEINDTSLYLLSQNGRESSELKAFVVDMCNNYPIMQFNDQSLVMQNIIYLEQKILNHVYPIPYAYRMTLLKYDEVYELYGLILVLNRLLRSYLNKQGIPSIIDALIGKYKVELYVCLCLNSLCLIVVMILLHYFIAMRLMKVNSKLNLLMKFLE